MRPCPAPTSSRYILQPPPIIARRINLPHSRLTTLNSPTQTMDRNTKRFFNGLTTGDQKALLAKLFGSDGLSQEAIEAFNANMED